MITLKDNLSQRVSGRLLLPLIRVFETKSLQPFLHTLRDRLRFVDRLYLTALGNLEVQVVARGVILTPSHLYLLRMVVPFPLVLVALVHGHPLAGLDVHDLFLSISHNLDIKTTDSAVLSLRFPCPLLRSDRHANHI